MSRLAKYIDEMCGKDHSNGKKKQNRKRKMGMNEKTVKLVFGGYHLNDNILDEITLEEVQDMVYSNIPKEKMDDRIVMREFENLLKEKVREARIIAKKVIPEMVKDLKKMED